MQGMAETFPWNCRQLNIDCVYVALEKQGVKMLQTTEYVSYTAFVFFFLIISSSPEDILFNV